MMIQTITETMFKDQFKALRPDNFSYEGLSALYNFLDDMGESEPVELDVIAICCDFSEEPLQDILDNYGLDSLEELQEHTMVVAVLDDSIVYQTY